MIHCTYSTFRSKSQLDPLLHTEILAARKVPRNLKTQLDEALKVANFVSAYPLNARSLNIHVISMWTTAHTFSFTLAVSRKITYRINVNIRHTLLVAVISNMFYIRLYNFLCSHFVGYSHYMFWSFIFNLQVWNIYLPGSVDYYYLQCSFCLLLLLYVVYFCLLIILLKYFCRLFILK